MRTLILSCAALTILTTLASPPQKFKLDQKAVAEYQARILKITGGEVIKKGKGFVAVVNQQKQVDVKEINIALAKINEHARIAFKVVQDESSAGGAGLTIRVIEATGKPPLLAAPEEGWAEVNVDALAKDLKTDSAKAKFLAPRLRKEIMRAFAFAAGAGGSGFAENILDIIAVRDLDYRDEFIPADAFDQALAHLELRGVTRDENVTYRVACQEGWAAAPTNDIQKAVWDEVHNPPNKPVKITYDKDKQKPVVK